MNVKYPARVFTAALLAAVVLLIPLAATQVSYAAQPAGSSGCTKNTFLGLVPWYQYLNLQEVPTDDTSGAGSGVCQITNFNDAYQGSDGADKSLNPFLLVGLAIVDDLLRIAALVAVGYVIYGGFNYMTSNGSPDGTKRAQQTIINALVGLALAVTAAAIVAFIGNKLSTGS